MPRRTFTVELDMYNAEQLSLWDQFQSRILEEVESPPDAVTESSSTVEDILHQLLGWDTAVLFLGFVIITVIWEISIAVASYVSVTYTGRKPFWIDKLKDEILALGVITLVLIACESSLTSICINGYTEEESECPEGQKPLFSESTVSTTHVLLFTLAVVHIVCMCASLWMTLLAARQWNPWEQDIKSHGYHALGMDTICTSLGKNGVLHFFHCIFAAWPSNSIIQKPVYSLMRTLFRIRLADTQIERVPRQLNFLNLVTQNLETDLGKASEHSSWVYLVLIAIYLFIPSQAWAIYWLALSSFIGAIILGVKMQSVVIHLCAIGLFDLETEIEEQQDFIRGFKRTKALSAQLDLSGSSRKPLHPHLHGHPAKDIELGVYEHGQGGDAEPGARNMSSTAHPRRTAQGSMTNKSQRPSDIIIEARKQRRQSNTSLPADSEKPAVQEGNVTDHPVDTALSQSQHVSPFEGESSKPSPPGMVISNPLCHAGHEMEMPDICEVMQPYRHRQQFHLQLEKSEQKYEDGLPEYATCKSLYWFKHSRVTLWLWELAFMLNSMCLTMILNSLVQHPHLHLQQEGVGLTVAILVLCCVTMVYLSVCVLPTYAIATLVASRDPVETIEKIRESKRALDEEYEGIGGVVVNWCFGVGKEKKGEGGKEEEIARNAFVAALANQAGVVGHQGELAERFTHPVFNELLSLWENYKPLTLVDGTEEGRPYQLVEQHMPDKELSSIAAMFRALDKDHSGSIGVLEMSGALKLLGTRATAEELEDMIREVDYDNSSSIDFKEFVIFMFYKFLDFDDDSYIGPRDLAEAYKHLGIEIPNSMDLGRMISWVDDDNHWRIELPEFMSFFYNLEAPDAAHLAVMHRSLRHPAHSHPSHSHGGHSLVHT